MAKKDKADKKAGMNEQAFREKHDLVFKIRQAVKLLQKGEFFTDAEFKENLVKTTSAVYRSRVDNTEFDAYRGKAGGVVYWSHPSSITKMKSEGVMQ